MSTVQVSLNTAASPPVTCNPKTTSINQGNETINWEQAQNQTFTFTSLSFPGNPACFGTPNVTASQISVTDNNNAASGDYPYIIVVTLNGQTYSSSAPGIAGGGSDPMIKNK